MLHRKVFVPLLGKFICLVHPTAYLSGRTSVSQPAHQTPTLHAHEVQSEGRACLLCLADTPLTKEIRFRDPNFIHFDPPYRLVVT